MDADDGALDFPLERYGLIGDSGTAALVSDTGSIDWLCLPRFDSDPVFGRLLDPNAGHFQVRPAEAFTSTMRYVPETAVLATTFETVSGRATMYDFFDARPSSERRRSLQPFRYLVRRIEGHEGSIPFEVEVAPRASFGGTRYRLDFRAGNLVCLRAGTAVFVHAPARFSIRGDLARAAFVVAAGERAHVAMSYAEGDPGVLPPGGTFAEDSYNTTVAYWRRWSSHEQMGGRAAEMIQRSALTLKLLTYAPSGGIVAAPTTSLPEQPGGSLNWDYRFVWVRDASRTMVQLYDLGYEEEAHAYLHWAANAASITRPKVRTLYTLHGGRPPPEREVEGLRGYLDSRPVRVGNAAADQVQLDNWGYIVDAQYVFSRRTGEVRPDIWKPIKALVQYVAEHWREPDHGIWEVRETKQHWVQSKVMCWVALDRGVRVVREFNAPGPADEWEREADAIKREVLERGYDAERNTFVRAFEDPRPDAALLYIPLVGFLPPDDDRVLGTIENIRKELSRDDLVYRYPPENGEGAFVACSFWLAEALALADMKKDAIEIFDAVCERAGPLGLLPEEIDPQTGRFLGNYPQGLSHIALLNAAEAIEGERNSEGF